jgi:hypothetical protein
MNDRITIRETFERPTPEYPEGSYLFRFGSRFIKSTGRFEGLADYFAPEDRAWMRLAILHRSCFIRPSACADMTRRWSAVQPCTALVKEGPKAMVVYGGGHVFE